MVAVREMDFVSGTSRVFTSALLRCSDMREQKATIDTRKFCEGETSLYSALLHVYSYRHHVIVKGNPTLAPMNADAHTSLKDFV